MVHPFNSVPGALLRIRTALGSAASRLTAVRVRLARVARRRSETSASPPDPLPGRIAAFSEKLDRLTAALEAPARHLSAVTELLEALRRDLEEGRRQRHEQIEALGEALAALVRDGGTAAEAATQSARRREQLMQAIGGDLSEARRAQAQIAETARALAESVQALGRDNAAAAETLCQLRDAIAAGNENLVEAFTRHRRAVRNLLLAAIGLLGALVAAAIVQIILGR